MAENPWLYDLRLWAADVGNIQRALGFRDYGVTREDIETQRYVGIFREVNDYFSEPLKLAIASDLADVPAEWVLPKGVNVLLDYGFLYGLTIKDRDFCRQHRAYNKFDTESAGIRFMQTTAGGLLENVDALKSIRDRLPGPLKLVVPAMPVKTVQAAFIACERADEWYHNQFGRWKPEGSTPPRVHEVYRPKEPVRRPDGVADLQ